MNSESARTQLKFPINEFRTETRWFRTWKICVFILIYVTFGVICTYFIYLTVSWAAIGAMAFWFTLLGLGMVFWVIIALVSIFIIIAISYYDPDYLMPVFRGITKIEKDGDVVVRSTRSGRELLRCTATNYTTKILVGCRYQFQRLECQRRPTNSEPVPVLLCCTERLGDVEKWVELFSLTHDQENVIADINGHKEKFPYTRRPDYLKVAKAIVHSYKPLGYIHEFSDCSMILGVAP